KNIGCDLVCNIQEIEKLLQNVNDDNFLNEFLDIKAIRKRKVANYIKQKEGIDIDVNSIFDVHIKRIHAYKRQLLNCLHIIYLYQKLKTDKNFTIYPRTFIFAGKAAP